MISIYLLQIFLAGVSGHHGPSVISIYLLQIFLAGVSGHHGPPVNVQISSRTEHDPVMRATPVRAKTLNKWTAT